MTNPTPIPERLAVRLDPVTNMYDECMAVDAPGAELEPDEVAFVPESELLRVREELARARRP